jgi:hypothetical protein
VLKSRLFFSSLTSHELLVPQTSPDTPDDCKRLLYANVNARWLAKIVVVCINANRNIVCNTKVS